MSRSRSFARGPTALLVAMAAGACEGGASASRTLTETFTIGAASSLSIDGVVSLSVRGARQSEVQVTLEATVTASTTATAELALDDYQILSAENAGTLQIVLPNASKGSLSGTATLVVPLDLPLLVVGRSGPNEVSNMDAETEIQSSGGVLAQSIDGNLRVGVNSGGALVDASAGAGQLLSIDVGEGSLELRLPAALDASFDMSASEGIGFAHPSFAPVQGITTYRQTIGLGLATIQANVRSGAARITVR